MHALGLSLGNTLGNYTAYNASGGGSAQSATTLRMSHLSAGRPYVTFLAPHDADTDAARRLHIHTFSDPAA